MALTDTTTDTTLFAPEQDDQQRMLAKLVSPTPAADLVGPPPDSAPAHQPGRSTPLTGTLSYAPTQAVAKNRDTAEGQRAYSSPISSRLDIGNADPRRSVQLDTRNAIPGQAQITPASQAYNTGVSNPPDGGAVTSISQAASPVQPLQQVQAARQNSYNASPAGQAANAVQPVMPAQIGTGGAQPVLPAGQARQVQPDALNMRTMQDQNSLAALTAQKSGGSQIQNKAGRVAARIGDTALSILAPGVAQYIPGSSLNHLRQVGQAQQVVGNDQSQQQARARLEDTAQQTNERAAKAAGEQPFTITAEQAKAVGQPALEGSQMRPGDYAKLPLQQLKNTGQIDKVTKQDIDKAPSQGMKAIDDPDSPGEKKIVPDEDSPIYQYKKSLSSLDDAKAELARAGNDPKSPAYQLALRKAQTASSNAAAATIRANAYALNANVGNLGVDNQGRAVNGISGNAAGPMGTRIAPQYAKAAGNIAKFQDVYSSIDNANAAIDEGDKSGVKFNTAPMAAALSDPKTTAQQWLTGKVNTTLTPAEQNIVITTKALHEQIMAMRGAIGAGGVSDAQANRLIDQLPSATTPDMAYARRQLAVVRQQLDNLQVGLPTVNNGPTVQPVGSPASPKYPGGVPKGIPRGGALPGHEVWVRDKSGKLVKQ